MTKKQYLNLNYKKSSKKGFIFTMDVAVALVITFSLMFTAAFFVEKRIQDPYPTLQLLRTGSDIARVMEYKGILNNPTENSVNNYLDTIVPPNSDMNIEILCNSGFSLGAGESPPNDQAIVSGKQYFYNEGDYCNLRYKIWLK